MLIISVGNTRGKRAITVALVSSKKALASIMAGAIFTIEFMYKRVIRCRMELTVAENSPRQNFFLILTLLIIFLSSQKSARKNLFTPVLIITFYV